jgi:hypothetical protein
LDHRPLVREPNTSAPSGAVPPPPPHTPQLLGSSARNDVHDTVYEWAQSFNGNESAHGGDETTTPTTNDGDDATPHLVIPPISSHNVDLDDSDHGTVSVVGPVDRTMAASVNAELAAAAAAPLNGGPAATERDFSNAQNRQWLHQLVVQRHKMGWCLDEELAPQAVSRRDSSSTADS